MTLMIFGSETDISGNKLRDHTRIALLSGGSCALGLAIVSEWRQLVHA